MSKAIKITHEIKDKNAKYRINFVENNAVGVIVSRGLPNKFYVTEIVSGSYATRTDLHLADGWKDIIVPSYNSATQKLGTEVIEVGNDFTYEVIALTQAEQDNHAQNLEDADAASQFFNKRKSDGEIYLNRFNAFVYRKVVNNETTKAQAISGLSFFYEAIHPLTVGYFEKSIELTTALSSGSQQLIDLKNKIITELQNYVDNE